MTVGWSGVGGKEAKECQLPLFPPENKGWEQVMQTGLAGQYLLLDYDLDVQQQVRYVVQTIGRQFVIGRITDSRTIHVGG